jgi:ribosome-associated protein
VPVKPNPSKSRPKDRAKAAVTSKASTHLKSAGTAKRPAAPTGISKPKTAPKPKISGKSKAGGKADAVRAKPSLTTVVIDALADMKALEVKVLDVRGLTDVADYMVIASGTSDRHVRSVAQRVVERTKEAGFRPHGVEGQQDSDWVLIDLNDMIVHVMLPRVREFYGLEKLWDMTITKRAARA